jgi:hypothetical protein
MPVRNHLHHCGKSAFIHLRLIQHTAGKNGNPHPITFGPMPKTRNILFLLLLTTMMAPLAAPFLLGIKVSLIKIASEERLERDQLQTVHIPKNKIHWAELNEELVIGNRLFDVKEFTENQEELIATGIFDDQETELEEQISSLWEQQKNRQGILLLIFLKELAAGYIRQIAFLLEAPETDRTYYNEQICFFQKDVFIKIPSPPPQA